MEEKKTFFLTGLVLILVFAFGFSRLFFLTVFMGGHYKELATGNMVKIEKTEAVRGVISDKNGKPLAINIENNGKTVRFYPGGEVTAAVVGYMGKSLEEGADPDILVGRVGLESSFQEKLAGKYGEKLIEETAQGTKKTEITRKEPVAGENIQTNLDWEVQKAAYLALKSTLTSNGKSGAVVVMTVDGKVLGLVSAPSYDPNLFINGGSRSDFGGEFKDVNDLLGDNEKKPLFNRAVSGDFAPGSVFKLVPALAALEEKKISKDTLIQDSGEIVIGNYRFGNWLLDKYGQTEGQINVVKAIARSNDIFFYKTGELLGVDNLVSWSKKLGLGETTGIDLPGESGGFVPTPYWREKTFGEKWFLGNTYHLSIGQGDLMTTPLQINRMTAAVVSGLSCAPRLVGTATCMDIKINENNRKTVLEGMMAACSKGGTAFPLYDYGGQIYCKTGTAQKGGEDTLPNAWLSMVIPVGQSVKDWVVVTVLVEEGGEGSAVAAPIAKELVPLFLK
ncbi:MAG TPA: penicillin-binding transpeptidase domain-containing protein [Candidatus Woesebacteria bacterium]|nr:penicillin-binding transpeptidase domain-containing protein [Candidatus Woesebacteria bacterium]